MSKHDNMLRVAVDDVTGKSSMQNRAHRLCELRKKILNAEVAEPLPSIDLLCALRALCVSIDCAPDPMPQMPGVQCMVLAVATQEVARAFDQWCVPCRIMKRKVWADDRVESMVKAGFIPILIDVGETGASSEALERYKTDVTPTTIIADAEGNVLEQVRGAMSKSEFLTLLEKPYVPTLVP